MKKRRDDASDDNAFAEAMAEVKPLAPDPRGRNSARPPISAPPRAPTTSTDDDVDGSNEDFLAPGVDRRRLRDLKRGEYRAAGKQDLHGLTAAAACASVGQFIDTSRHSGHRCVCIVPGRGSHSEGMVPVLMPRVRAYLRSHPSVLAFTRAPKSKGGAGALYVLLRK